MHKFNWLLVLVLSLHALGSNTSTFTTKNYGTKFSFGLKRNEKSKQFVRQSPKLLLPKCGNFPKGDCPITAIVIDGARDLSPQVSPPEDQLACGECWAFALVKALRSEFMILGFDPGRLAFNFLGNNCGLGPRQGGCMGGDFNAGESLVKGGGPWLEAADPYTGKDGGRCLNLPPKATALTFVQVGSGKSPPTFQELAYANSQNHVLVIDLAVCGALQSYWSGIFNQNDCGSNSINHMLNMVGYDCQTSVDKNHNCVWNSVGQPINGDGFLKIMNNWGTGWGEKGYMRIRYGIDAVANTAMFFTVQSGAGNGGWSAWGPWGPCANGKQSHTRTCTNPVPSKGGAFCSGPSTETESCGSPPPPCTGFLCSLFRCGLPWCKVK